MEDLTPAQKTTVTKSSTERLRLLLMRSGYAEEVVLAWSRDQLMGKYAELLVQGLDPAMVVRPVDPELEKARLAQEAAQLQMQRELETAKLKAEAAQRESQERLEMERLALEKQKLDLKIRKLDADLELQRLDLERDKLKHDADFKSAELDVKDRTQNDEMKVIKRYGDFESATGRCN